MFISIYCVYFLQYASLNVYVYHHGSFLQPPESGYVRGRVDYLENIDTDVICFDHLLHYSVLYDYDYENSLVYFQCDGNSFDNGVRILYDDNSVKDMVNVSIPHGKIKLFVDHFNVEELETTNVPNEGNKSE